MKDNSECEFVGKMEEQLLKLPEWFLRIGKSHIVNTDYIVEYEEDCCVMKNGKRLSVTRSYKCEFRKAFLRNKNDR